MHLFKTSGATFNSVIKNEMHAFINYPQNIKTGDLILVSKNQKDLAPSEKQIRYVMELKEIRGLRSGEIEKYWPGNEGRWNYLIICQNTKKLKKPLNLENAIGPVAAKKYKSVMTFKEIEHSDEIKILKFFEKET